MVNASKGYRHFYCRRRLDNKGCEGVGTQRVQSIEEIIYEQMCHKMADYQTLRQGSPKKANPKLSSLNVSLAQVEAEIEKLLSTLTGASSILMSYANSKIEELDGRRQALLKKISDLSAEYASPQQMERISGYLDSWDMVSFDDKRLVVDGLISSIKVADSDISIEWKI